MKQNNVNENSNNIAVLSQSQLMWRRFKKHRLAYWGGSVVIIVYVIALFVEFLAPGHPRAQNAEYQFAPPQRIRLIKQTDAGNVFQPHVYGYEQERDPITLGLEYKEDRSQIINLGFFVQGETDDLWGFIPLNRNLIGPIEEDAPFYPLGADRLGRNILSRIIYGTRVSMSVGLVGVILSVILGILLGGISGYYGGVIDNIIQRSIEVLQSIPQIPLWLGLAAAIPRHYSPVQVYFFITVILSLIAWTGLGRQVRGKFMSLRTVDFVIAARIDGASEMRIILRHMVPSFMSHIIATMTLAIPTMILAETSLSFLGVGLRPPVISWGVLLQEAQNIRTIADAPWLLTPGLAVIISVLALNFLGDGLRDAADPHGSQGG